jgi:methionyl-tRNA formyltransferase
MLPKVVLMPELGTFNLHHVTPTHYRGAAINNQGTMRRNKNGVTTFFIDDKIDTGAMILNSEIEIDPNENVGHLYQ